MTTPFGRQVIVQLDEQSYTCGGEGRLRCQFAVTKTLRKGPNTAKISLYNPAASAIHGALAKKRKLRVRLLVGHETPALVFEGNPIKNGLVYDRQEVDRVLAISAGDGLGAYKDAKVRLSLKGEVTFAQVIDEAIVAMGLPRGVIEIPGDARMNQSFSFSGPAQELLGRLAHSLGCDFSIQDGQVQFLPKGKTRGLTGPRYARDLGNLIGAPKPKDKGVQIVVLCDPLLLPGDRFLLDDPIHGGAYKAVALEHRGDSGYSNEYYTTIDGVPS